MCSATKNRLYVAFPKKEKHGSDEVHGKGPGYVDVFNNKGKFVIACRERRTECALGMAIAPKSFGTFAGALLVGNFGDGKINAYDRTTGDFIVALSDSTGKPLVIDGLWALDPGPGSGVTFSAGPNDESRGLVGLLEPNQ